MRRNTRLVSVVSSVVLLTAVPVSILMWRTAGDHPGYAQRSTEQMDKYSAPFMPDATRCPGVIAGEFGCR